MLGDGGFPYKGVQICVDFYPCIIDEHCGFLKGNLTVLD